MLRLADTDEHYCAGMQQAYLCSEKRKVRAKSGGEAVDAALAERLKRCKVADRMRHAVQTRTMALERASSNHTRATDASHLSQNA